MTDFITGLHYPIDINALPKTWCHDYVGAFAESVQSGFACGNHNSNADGVVHIRPMNVCRAGRIELSDLRFVPSNYDDRRLDDGDVLFNNTNSPELIGKTAYVGREGAGLAFSNHMTRIRFTPAVEPRFGAAQLHYLWGMKYFLHRCVKHVNQASVSSSDLAKSVPLVVPPLAEQRRIVYKIEELFTELEKGVEALATARHQLIAYRQAVLKHAFEGGFTTHFRATQPVWRSVDLGDEIEFLTSGSRGWAEYYAESGDTFIRAQNLKHDRLDLTDIAFVKLPEGNTEGLRTRVKVGDVLITITGANVTKTGFVTSEIGTAFVSQHVALCRLRPSILPAFLYWYLLSETNGRRQLTTMAYGAGKPGLNLDNIRSVTLTLPSPDEQKVVVERIEAALSMEQELSQGLDAELRRTNALRQSILKQAFSGQLVAQDARDEPASELLERMRAGDNGEAAKKMGRTRKKNAMTGRKKAAV